MTEVTYFVALPFVAADDGITAGEPTECFNPTAVVMRAEVHPSGSDEAPALTDRTEDAGYPRRPLRGACHHGQAAGILAGVPVKAALHVARPHEVVDPSLQNGLERALLVRPVAEEIADMRPACFA
jgi:hypothetical protein